MRNDSARYWRRIALAIFLVGLVFRVIIFSQYSSGYVTPEQLAARFGLPAYAALALNMVSGNGFAVGDPPEPTVRRPPGYPAFLALSYEIGGRGNALPAVVVQLVLDAMTAVLVFVLARLAWPAAPRWAATAAGFLYALNPFQSFLAAGTLPETLFTFLLTGGVTLLALAIRHERARFALVAGLALALAALTRAIALGFTILTISALLVAWVRTKHLRWRGLAAALAIGFFVVIAPWVVRNYAVAGEFIPIHSGFGNNLYLPSFAELDQKDQQKLYPVYLNDPITVEASRLSPNAGDALLTRAALAKIASQPLVWLRSRAENYPFLFVYGGDFMVEKPVAFGDLIRSRDWPGLARKVGYALAFSLLPLGLAIRAALRRDNWNTVALIVAGFWIYNALFHTVAWIEPRFYTPAVPFLYAWAGQGLVGLPFVADRGRAGVS